MKILLTAFDPFGGASVNPAWEAVSRVREDLPGIALRKLLVPTVFAESGALVNRTANEWGAEAVICVGHAGAGGHQHRRRLGPGQRRRPAG